MESRNRSRQVARARSVTRDEEEESGDAGIAPCREEAVGTIMKSRRWRDRAFRALVLTALLAAAGCSGSSPALPAPTPTPAPTPPPASGPLLVTRVIDGDTIVVEVVGTVRLIGVDTPEPVHPREPVGCFGPEASAFTRSVATGQMVRLEYDVDRFDRFERTLAYIYLPDGTFLNAALVQQGYGRAYTFFPFRYLEEFRALEREAREARRGLWAVCTTG